MTTTTSQYALDYGSGQLKLHETGTEFLVEHWEDGELVEVEESFDSKLPAMGYMIEKVSDERKDDED